MISNEKPTYNSVTNEINELNVEFKDKALSLITALIFALLIILGPFIIAVNLTIFKDLRGLLILSMELLLILFVFLTEFFYLKGITKGKVKNLKQILVVDTMVVSMVILALGLILSYMGVF